MEPEYEQIDPALIESLQAYQNEGVRTGGFLRAVLSNALVEAVGRADYRNIHALRDIVSYVYNELNGQCWGSPKKVTDWLEAKRLEREAAEAKAAALATEAEE